MLCHGKRMDVVRYEDMKVAARKGEGEPELLSGHEREIWRWWL